MPDMERIGCGVKTVVQGYLLLAEQGGHFVGVVLYTPLTHAIVVVKVLVRSQLLLCVGAYSSLILGGQRKAQTGCASSSISVDAGWLETHQ